MATRFAGTPVHYIAKTKCGSTTVRNLAWTVATGEHLDDQESVHDKLDEVPGLTVPNRTLGEGDVVFGVVRDPVSRFVSLYNDKVASRGAHSARWLRKYMKTSYGLTGEHYQDCCNLLCVVVENLTGAAPFWKVDGHWSMQTDRAQIYAKHKAVLIPLPALRKGLEHLLSPHLPDMSATLDRVGRANRSPKFLTMDAVRGTDLEDDILNVYYLDQMLYERSQIMADEMGLL